MTPSGSHRAGPAHGPERRRVDLLYVSLGGTFGLRRADDQLVAELRAAGKTVEVVRAELPREVRTLMLTDLTQALAVRRATRAALRTIDPTQIIYSTTTAALLWPRPGAIRFDALAQQSRPGHHGLWQRPLERRRLRQASVLIPWATASLAGAPPSPKLRRAPVVVPIPIRTGDAAASTDPVLAALPAGSTPVAVTYGADPSKKGLDRLLHAWAAVRKPGELLLVTGRAGIPTGLGPTDGVHVVGNVDSAVFRALIRTVGVLALAPRREDYGLVQLEALAEGARVVTTEAPGPYVALALVRDLWPAQVVPAAEADDPAALGAALRHAIDGRAAASAPTNDKGAANGDALEVEQARAAEAVAAWQPQAVQLIVERDLLPALGPMN